jgi:hypothetical protein
MEWKDLAKIVAGAAPILGTLIGGPAGAAVGAIVASGLGVGNTPDEVSQALLINPEASLRLKEIEATRQTELRTLLVQSEANRLAADTATIQAVNVTMQLETKAEHWPTYSWRPFIGFCVGINTISASLIVMLVFVPVMFGVKEAAAAMANLPMVLGSLAAISATVLPILGIASYFRGKAQADPGISTDNRG